MWDKGIQAKGKVRQSQKYQSQRQEFLSSYIYIYMKGVRKFKGLATKHE